MAANFNVLMARKTIGGIHHRLAEQGLDNAVRRCIAYNLSNVLCISALIHFALFFRKEV